VKRGFLVSVGGAAIVVAGLAGCSSDSGSSESTTSAEATAETSDTATASASAEATSAPGGAKVVIDGQDQNIQGTVACTAMGGNINIAIGQATTGIGAVVTEADPPAVQSVGLGNVNGVTLGFQQGTGQGNAEVEKDDKTYNIKGNATGIDMANPLQPVTKPFEIEVTCP
jgi:lipoprotein LpqH